MLIFSLNTFAQVTTGSAGGVLKDDSSNTGDSNAEGGVVRRQLKVPIELISKKNQSNTGHGASNKTDNLDLVNYWEEIRDYYESINTILELDYRCAVKLKLKKNMLTSARDLYDVVSVLSISKSLKAKEKKLDFTNDVTKVCKCDEVNKDILRCITSDAKFDKVVDNFFNKKKFIRAHILINSSSNTLSGSDQKELKKEAKSIRKLLRGVK